MSTDQRRADHETGHYVAFKSGEKRFSGTPQAFKIVGFKISIKIENLEKGLLGGCEVYTDPPPPLNVYLGHIFAGIAAEAYGMYMAEHYTRDHALTYDELMSAIPVIRELAIRSFEGGTSGAEDMELLKKIMLSGGAITEEESKSWSIRSAAAAIDKILLDIDENWALLKKISGALLLHTTITSENYHELVELSEED